MRRRRPGRELELRPDDDLDGCDLDFTVDITRDEDIQRLLEERPEEEQEMERGDHAV